MRDVQLVVEFCLQVNKNKQQKQNMDCCCFNWYCTYMPAGEMGTALVWMHTVTLDQASLNLLDETKLLK